MAEIPETCEFNTPTSKITLNTAVNGDVITIHCGCLDSDAVSSLAWLLNTKTVLKIKIKDAY